MTEDFEIETIDVGEGVEGWKNEVKKLLDEIHHLRTENAGSQLIAALVLKHSGPVLVEKQAIADGLPGYEIQISEPANGVIEFSLKSPDEDGPFGLGEDDTPDASVLHEQ